MKSNSQQEKPISFKTGVIILGLFTLVLLLFAAIVVKQGYDETEAFKAEMRAEVDEIVSYLHN